MEVRAAGSPVAGARSASQNQQLEQTGHMCMRASDPDRRAAGSAAVPGATSHFCLSAAEISHTQNARSMCVPETLQDGDGAEGMVVGQSCPGALWQAVRSARSLPDLAAPQVVHLTLYMPG